MDLSLCAWGTQKGTPAWPSRRVSHSAPQLSLRFTPEALFKLFLLAHLFLNFPRACMVSPLEQGQAMLQKGAVAQGAWGMEKQPHPHIHSQNCW